MSTPALLTRTDRWVVVTRRPVYAVPAGDSYYLRAQQVEHDNPRHLRVVEFVVAPPEDPALDW